MKPREEFVHKAAQLWCLPEHASKVMDTEFAMSIAQALQEAHEAGAAKGRSDAAKAVPSNWLDPLLTGPKADKWDDCRKVERLLHGVRVRIQSLAPAAEEKR